MEVPTPKEGTWWILSQGSGVFEGVPHLVVESEPSGVIAWSDPRHMVSRPGHTWRGPVQAFFQLFKPANQ